MVLADIKSARFKKRMNKMYESVEMYFLLFLQFTVLSDVLFSCKKLNVDL